MTRLHVSTVRDEGIPALVLRCDGSVDAHTYDQLEKALEEALENGAQSIVVDLARVSYVSSAGLGVLLNATGRAADDGKALVLLTPSAEVADVLRVTGLDQVLAIARSPEELPRRLAPTA